MKMFMIVLITLMGYPMCAQVLRSDSLAGIWICQEVTFPEGVTVPQNEQEALKSMKEAMVSCQFEFKSNGFFFWSFPKRDAITNELAFLNNQKWQISSEGVVIIGDPRKNLMQIMVLQRQGSTYFVLADTPLLLRMQKKR